MLYEGLWAFGQNECFDVSITQFILDERKIHNLVRNLKIGEECLRYIEELKIVDYSFLRSIEIGNGSLVRAEVFEVKSCGKLEKIGIGRGCFGASALVLSSGLV